MLNNFAEVLGMDGKCPFCGEQLGTLTMYEREIHGKAFSICSNCRNAFKKIDSGNPFKVDAGKSYFQARLKNNETAPEALPLVREILGETVSDEEIETATVSIPEGAFAQNNVSGDVGLNIGGAVFLILAVILYFISVDNSYSVANIQTTVFAAASTVAAVVCFAAGQIIRVINRKL